MTAGAGAAARSSRFGPSALVTPANAVTATRLVLAPVLVAVVAAWGANWGAVVLAFCVASTDGLDGWIARRQGTTTSGAFLDPLADKVFVLGVLAVLAARAEIDWLPVALICVREIAMQAYRSVVARAGVSIPARTSAKAKTLVQDLTVGLCLLPPLAHDHHGVLEVALGIAVVLTLITGVQYVMDGTRARRTSAPVSTS